MRALIVQHEPDGPGGLLVEHLHRRGHDTVVLQVMEFGSTHSDVAFPDPASFDLIVPLGSVHGVYERDVIGSWIGREIDMLAAAHAAGVPQFGVCFGSQALTAALGGTVEKAPRYEIGWYQYDADGAVPFPTGPWFTWHGDRCVLPTGVDVLARTEVCPQVFRAGKTVGVQFHPEVTGEIVAGWIGKCSDEYFRSKGADPAEMLAGFDRHGALVAQQAAELFDWFLDGVADA